MQLNKLNFTVYIQILQKVSIYRKVKYLLKGMHGTNLYNDDLHKYLRILNYFFFIFAEHNTIYWESDHWNSPYDHLSIQQG